MKKIVAIGGYWKSDKKKVFFDTPICIDEKIKKLSGKKSPLVLFIPTASNDAAGYIEVFKNVYGKSLNCKIDTLELINKKYKRSELKKKILQADIIYVGGGNTKKMMRIWKKFDMGTYLFKAYQQGIVLAGVSAGAICWFEYGIGDSTKKRVKGLGILKGTVFPHFSKERVQLMEEYILKKLKDKYLGIPNGKAVFFMDAKVIADY